MPSRNDRLIVLIVACICIAIVASILTISIVETMKDNNATEQYNREKSRLEYEKTQLLLERDRVKAELYSELGPHAFLTLLVNSMDDEFVGKFYDELTKYSVEGEENGTFTATLLLSPQELPGLEGKMTKEKFDWYLERGYKYAIAYDSSVPLEEFLANMHSLLSERDIAFPGIICYYGDKKDSILKESDKAILEKYGIVIAASMKGDGLMVEQNMYDGVFSPGILGWNTINVSANTFNYAVNKGGNFGFIFGNVRNNTSIYKTSSFVDLDGSEWHRALLRMLDRVLNAANNGKLVVTDYENGLARRREFLMDYNELQPTLVSALEGIDLRLSEIENELSIISDKYKR